MSPATPASVGQVLAPARRALALTRIERYAFVGLAVAALCALLFIVAAHLVWLPIRPPWGLVLLPLGLLAGLAFALMHRPTLTDAARRSDQRFALHDRLTTALEFESHEGHLTALQRRDVIQRVAALRLSQVKGPFPLREALMAGIGVVAVALGLAFGGSTPARATFSTATDRQRIQQAALVQLPSLIGSLGRTQAGNVRSQQTLRKLRQSLAQLRRQLLHSQTRASALRAISVTQQKISQLSGSLGKGKTSSFGAKGKASPSAEQANRQLLKRQKKGSNGRSAAKGANGKIKPPRIPSTRTSNSSKTPHAQIKKSSLIHRISVQQQLEAAQNQLNKLKNLLSGLGKKSHRKSKSGRQKNTSKGPSVLAPGKALKRGPTKKGRGLAVNRGKVSNAGPSANPGKNARTVGGTKGGRSSGLSHQRGSGGQLGFGSHVKLDEFTHRPYNLVIARVRSRSGKGTQLLLKTTAHGAPGLVRLVPYQAVIVRYRRVARAQVQQANLPPRLRQYVSRYFDTIGH